MLIMPVQRLPRYKLFLERLMKVANKMITLTSSSAIGKILGKSLSFASGILNVKDEIQVVFADLMHVLQVINGCGKRSSQQSELETISNEIGSAILEGAPDNLNFMMSHRVVKSHYSTRGRPLDSERTGLVVKSPEKFLKLKVILLSDSVVVLGDSIKAMIPLHQLILNKTIIDSDSVFIAEEIVKLMEYTNNDGCIASKNLIENLIKIGIANDKIEGNQIITSLYEQGLLEPKGGPVDNLIYECCPDRKDKLLLLAGPAFQCQLLLSSSLEHKNFLTEIVNMQDEVILDNYVI